MYLSQSRLFDMLGKSFHLTVPLCCFLLVTVVLMEMVIYYRMLLPFIKKRNVIFMFSVP